MAPLQKRALWGLIAGLAFAVAFVLVFTLMGGIDNFDKNTSFRIIIDVLWIGGLVANLIIVNMALNKPGMVDERDKLIADRAPRVQWIAVIITLVAWVITLNEVYRSTHLIPSVFLFVIFMSVLIVSTIAQCLGILIGYWRMNRNA
jgi:hypothetical protein